MINDKITDGKSRLCRFSENFIPGPLGRLLPSRVNIVCIVIAKILLISLLDDLRG